MGHVGIPSTEIYRWCNPIRLVVDKQGYFAFPCSKFSVMSKDVEKVFSTFHGKFGTRQETAAGAASKT